MRIFLLLFITLIGCNTTKTGSYKSKNKPLKMILEFNDSRYTEFGIPAKYHSSTDHIIEMKKDTFSLKNDSFSIVLILDKKREKVSFNYNEENYFISGNFVLPEFNKIGYHISIDPVNVIADKVKAYFYKQPIRNGEWVFKENGTVTKEVYNISIENP